MFNKNKFKKRVLFVGIPDMAYICLEGLNKSGANIVGVVGPKKVHATYYDFKAFVNQKKLNFIEYDELDDVFFIDKIRALKADIAVVCSFNYKVPKILLDSVKDGFINVHPSLLPEYRGPNPYTSVIINNEKETGVTLHFMDEKFDTGDIVIQKKIPISDVETMGTLFNRTNIIAFELLLEILKKYEKMPLERIKQPEGEFKKANMMVEEDLNINYKSTAIQIECLIRGLNPFILARTNFRGTLLKILTAETSNEEIRGNYPVGTIAKIDKDKFYISTGKGFLIPTSMQFGSFFAGTAKEFIKILNPRIGEKFE